MVTLFLMRLSLVILAGFSATSAVVGLGSVFQGIYWEIIIAGVGLELAKYVSAAYAYQEWDYMTKKFRASLVAFIFTISILTSVGIFGYLGHSFQTSHVVAQKDDLVATQLEAKKIKLESRLLEIDKQIASLPANSVNGRMRLIRTFDVERKDIRDTIKEIEPKLLEAQTTNIVSTGDLGPIVYLAKTFGISVDTAVGYMMLVLTLSLDPFALFLTVLINRPRHHSTRFDKPLEESTDKVIVETEPSIYHETLDHVPVPGPEATFTINIPEPTIEHYAHIPQPPPPANFNLTGS